MPFLSLPERAPVSSARATDELPTSCTCCVSPSFSARRSDDVEIAGILHDVLEDTSATAEDIELLFGANVLRLVEGLRA